MDLSRRRNSGPRSLGGSGCRHRSPVALIVSRSLLLGLRETPLRQQSRACKTPEQNWSRCRLRQHQSSTCGHLGTRPLSHGSQRPASPWPRTSPSRSACLTSLPLQQQAPSGPCMDGGVSLAQGRAASSRAAEGPACLPVLLGGGAAGTGSADLEPGMPSARRQPRPSHFQVMFGF